MSFQQGLSGLNATSKSLEVIGNNIANANTFGAKSARAEFADMYAAALNGAGGNAIGMGVNIAAVSQQFTQGNITATENPMDVAINGSGFFMMQGADGATSFSRNGQFKVDRNGYIVNSGGDRLLGNMASASGTIIPGQPVALQLPTAGISPTTTTQASLELNLNKGANPVPSTVPFAANNPQSYNNATVMTVYDAAGAPVNVQYYFRKIETPADTWDVYVVANGQPVATDADGNPVPSNRLSFAEDGSTFTATQTALTIPANADRDTLAINITDWNFEGSTQYNDDFATTNIDQNGNAPGALAGISISDDGTLVARYTNGDTRDAGRVQLASFRNPQGLQPGGGNRWFQSAESGGPTIDYPGTGAFGALQAGSLEESNVDLTGELVNMITAQRNYQANAQTIKTMDQVLQTLVNLR